MRDTDKRTKFFFAETAAGMYDVTIDLVVPNYSYMHSMVLYLLRASRVAKEGSILDVGSGTGADSISILKAFPKSNVVSLDLCDPIQQEHRRKLHQIAERDTSFEQRSRLVLGDILQYSATAEGLLEHTGGKKYSAVVSSLVIHHFTHSQKKWFYQLAFDLLKPGGILVNADLFAYRDPRVYRYAYEFDLDWMKKNLLSPPDQFPKSQALPIQERKRLLQKWLRHYEDANRLEPLEDGGQLGQITLLRQAGFTSVGVPYRMSLSGIIVGHKP